MRGRRKSMAPRRPFLFAEQYGPALLTAVVVVASIGLVVWAVFLSH